MPRVLFKPYNIEVEVSEAETILDAARKAGIYIRSVCGGKGICKKCLVKVASGRFKCSEQVGEYQLACRTYCLDFCEVFIPPESRLGVQKLLTHANLRLEVELAPRIDIKLVEENLFEIRYIDEDRVIKQARGGELRAYGLAADVGTTKVVLYLVDLFTGDVVYEDSFTNPQMTYGDDVVSRIEFCRRNPHGVKILQKVLIEKINEVLDKACAKLGIARGDIIDGVLVGNTVMTYTVLGHEDITKLVETSYKPPRKLYKIRAHAIGLNINEKATITLLPCVSRYFGGDLVADVIATRMYEKDSIQLLIDIGTNTQVILGCSEWMVATSGPGATAFEGWGVTCGVRATEGAIERVKIEGGEVRVETIGGARPIGLCGSGLIDLLAELFRNGIIDERGRIVATGKRVRERPDGTREFVVVEKEKSGTGTDIVITERDIANIIDSKATVCALVSTLLKKMRLSVRDVEKVYICGGFATYLNIANAVYIGLLPEFPNAEIVFVGNGAIAGAYMTLVNYELRRKAEEIAAKITYIDMVTDADFLEEYQANLCLPGKPELFPSLAK